MIEIAKPPSRVCTVDDIKQLEREIGAHLPHDYATFLLRSNGGYCAQGADGSRSVFDFRVPIYGGLDERGAITSMYSCGLVETEGTVFDNILDMRQAMSHGDPPIPDGMIPIGETIGSWVITLGVAGRFREGVYLNMNRGEMNWEDILLAGSFTGFEMMVTQRVD